MAKKKEKKVNVSGKPKHSLDVNRSNGGDTKGGRTAATVRRLKMYNNRPKRDRKGKILKHELQSKELPNTRIEPDRRWFGNTRVVNQKELEFFREELQNRLSNNYNVILKERKLPLSLLNDHQKQAKAHLLDTEPFEDAFGPKRKRKRPKLLACDYESLVKKADGSQDAFEQKSAAWQSREEGEEDGLRDLVRHTMFEKGQSKRIWGELYKVVDSSDVVVQVLDARDPQGTRCHHLEKHLKENCKHKHMILLLNKGSLLSVLRQFARLKSDKQAISVGFVGYPNVGKVDENDFLVQLCRSTGKLLKLWLDYTPDALISLFYLVNITFEISYFDFHFRMTPQNHGSHYSMLGTALLKYLVLISGLPSFQLTPVFYTDRHVNPEGGEPDLMTAAKMILHDWQRGKIPFFVPPPQQQEGDPSGNSNSPDASEEEPTISTDRTAAAMKAIAGGITTVIDMPLNSFPSTVSEETLRLKVEATEKKIYVNVGFWGGLVPENAFNTSALQGLLNAGFWGGLVPENAFNTSALQGLLNAGALGLKEGLYVLAKYNRPLLIHAEIVLDSERKEEMNDGGSDARSYATYLKTRPPSWEEAAIRELQEAMQDTKFSGRAEGAHVHIVHLSDAKASLDLIKYAKSSGASVSVETCPHYLAFAAEEIPDGDTRFKIVFQEQHIDMLSSDHSPSVPDLKLFDEGDFLKAWGGISSLQGAIVRGNHADLVVWEPEVEFELDENHKTYHKHPTISPYMGMRLSGKASMQPKLVESAGLEQKSLPHSRSPTHNEEKAGKERMEAFGSIRTGTK
ncbi:putative Nuclear/nucleolar GTPase 2 [Cocos nucifera]|uniref:Nuclear/nucleolar GTPase 2 n=1 Tax=Cocos nucifera TaxID=13894 RepID=A0A8K0ILV1_COCNU|nr:putative Nuclear/nucleolar GTPase 2 [Cocos nucifera]